MATPSTPATTGAAAGSSSAPTETVTHIQMAGLTVLMIKTKDQVIYKLPDNMSVQSLTQEQRDRLLAEINLLHHQQTTAQAIAATQAQTQQVQMAQAQAQAQSQQGVRPIAPLGQSNGAAGISSATTPTAAGGASHRSSPSAPSTPTGSGSSSTLDGQQKTTRRYNKTGKYSKKKLMQQQALEGQGEAKGTQPYARPSEKSKSATLQHQQQQQQQPQQPLVFNNTNPQAYQAAQAVSHQPSTAQTAVPPTSPLAVSLSILQLYVQQLQLTGTSLTDQQRQINLLKEINGLRIQIDAQQTSTNTFREHEKSIQRVLAQRNVDVRTQQLARQNTAEAEKALDLSRAQLREKEQAFREQFPVATQKMLLLQQQHHPAANASSIGGTGSSSLVTAARGTASVSTKVPAVPNAPKTVEEQLQQQIAEHHDSVRNGMALEVQKTHKEVRRSDYRTPFSSLHDAIERLLPFHVFQYPAQDIESQAKAFANRSEADLNARALLIHKRKHDLYSNYSRLLKTSATKLTTTNPSSALDIIALRYGLEDEREEHKKVSEQNAVVESQAKVLREELERRQLQVFQQRRAEAAMIEQQQKLMLERQRQDELEKQQLEQQQQQMMAQIRQMQELQQQQQSEEMQEMHMHLEQQQEQQLTEEQEEEKKRELERKELERQHQQELEKQMRIKQEQILQEQEETARQTAAAAAAVTAAAAVASASPASTPAPDVSSIS